MSRPPESGDTEPRIRTLLHGITEEIADLAAGVRLLHVALKGRPADGLELAPVIGGLEKIERASVHLFGGEYVETLADGTRHIVRISEADSHIARVEAAVSRAEMEAAIKASVRMLRQEWAADIEAALDPVTNRLDELDDDTSTLRVAATSCDVAPFPSGPTLATSGATPPTVPSIWSVVVEYPALKATIAVAACIAIVFGLARDQCGDFIDITGTATVGAERTYPEPDASPVDADPGPMTIEEALRIKERQREADAVVRALFADAGMFREGSGE